MSKVYRGYELMKLVSQGKLSLKQRVNSLSIDYKNCTIDFILKDRAENIMDLDFELIEDEIDIDSIEEIDIDQVINTDDKTGIALLHINKLVQAVKQLNKEIKSIKEKEYCQVCGVELTRENKYMNGMCNDCKYGEE